jgi:hypothetical protein
MNGIELILGVLIGAVTIGTVLFCYLLIGTVKTLTDQVRHLTDVLSPILESDEILKSLRSFRVLAEVGDGIGHKMDALNVTINQFYKFAVANQTAPTTQVPLTADGSGVYGYNEEAAAARANSSTHRAPEANTEDAVVLPEESRQVF